MPRRDNGYDYVFHNQSTIIILLVALFSLGMTLGAIAFSVIIS